MIFVLSPAKSLDFTTPPLVADYSQPEFLDRSAELIAILRTLAPQEIAELMDLSDKLAVLNAGRYGEWQLPFTPGNAKQAVLAFDGDVYDGLDATSLLPEDLAFAQGHLRILSGLYGVLRPLDLMQPYRLEMGTRLANPAGKDLYAFWGRALADNLNVLLERESTPVLVNLASEEYFKAVAGRGLRFPVVQPVFEDWKGGRYKIISFFAKRARGLMARYAILNRLDEPEGLKGFDLDGYVFEPSASDDSTWVFRRRLAG